MVFPCYLSNPQVNGRQKDLSTVQDETEIKTAILGILKEHKVSLSQVRGIFESIIIDIEDDNPITL